MTVSDTPAVEEVHARAWQVAYGQPHRSSRWARAWIPAPIQDTARLADDLDRDPDLPGT